MHSEVNDIGNRSICRISSSRLIELIAWVEIVWYTSETLHLIYWSWNFLASEAEQIRNVSTQFDGEADDGFIIGAMGTSLAIVIVGKSLRALMGAVLLHGITTGDSKYLMAWLLYAVSLVISEFSVQMLRDPLDTDGWIVQSVFVAPRLFGVYVVASHFRRKSYLRCEDKDKIKHGGDQC